MKLRNSAICALILGSLFSTMHGNKESTTKPLRLLIIDTDGSREYYYRNVILMANSVGFTTDYYSLYDILEDKQISSYDAVFLLMSLNWLKNIKSDIGQKFIKILEDFSKQSGKLIGIFAPGTSRFNPLLLQLVASFCETMGIFRDESGIIDPNTPLRAILHSFLQNILQPDGNKGSLFGTTLINEQTHAMPAITDHTGKKFETTTDEKTGETVAALLPTNKNFSPLTQKTFPIGLYVKNPATNNTFFISKTSEFTFADLAENFFRSPIHIEQRTELLQAVQQTLWELYIAYKNNYMPAKLTAIRPPLPRELTVEFIEQEKSRVEQQMNKLMAMSEHYAWIADEGISCGWLEPRDYYLYEDGGELQKLEKDNPEEVQALKAVALQQGVEFIYNADLNLLWFEFNPETYLGINGRYKEQKESFIKKTRELAQAIKEIFDKKDKPFPKIFMGTDITTNYGVHPVPCAVVDVFGHTYSKVPCPLDFKHFWEPEVIDVFDAFYATFNDILPLAGVFLDFEMYHAQDQAGSYSDQMDFSDNAWQIYCAATGKTEASKLNSVAEKVAYLSQNSLFKEYFATLEQEAYALGKRIKDHIRSVNPKILIGAYAPCLPRSWFELGIMGGLSSQTEPLILTTFNTDFYSHYQWLANNKLYAIHGAPILLSKIQSTTDFTLIPELLRYHYFVWYLRPSRMIYKQKNNRWWSSEASPLDPETLAEGISEHRK